MGVPLIALAAASAISAAGEAAAGAKQQAQEQQNANIASQNAATAGLQGGLESYSTGLKTADEVGTQKVDFAANNVTENSASAQNVIAGTRKAGETNQSALQFTTANQVQNQMYQASSDKSAGSAAFEGGLINAAGTLMGSAAQGAANSRIAGMFGSSATNGFTSTPEVGWGPGGSTKMGWGAG